MTHDEYINGADCTSNPGSPYFTGTDCVNCGRNTYNADDEGFCDMCHRIECKFCGELVNHTDIEQTESGKFICRFCVADPDNNFKFYKLASGKLRMVAKKIVLNTH